MLTLKRSFGALVREELEDANLWLEGFAKGGKKLGVQIKVGKGKSSVVDFVKTESVALGGTSVGLIVDPFS